MAQNDVVLQSKLEYLSLNKGQRILYKIGRFFKNTPKAIGRFFSRIPSKTRKKGAEVVSVFRTISDAARFGDIFTRISFFVMGFGLFFRHQMIRGFLYFLYEIIFIVFMIFVGGSALTHLASFGQVGSMVYTIVDDATMMDIETTVLFDNSFTILLYSIITILLILVLAFLWYNQLRDSIKLQRMSYIGKTASDKATLKNVFDKSYSKTLLFIPTVGLVLFTIIPLIIVVLIAFTDYNSNHLTPARLIDWIGLYNFEMIFASTGTSNSSVLLEVFGQVLLWTLVWAFFATFSNYFLGMIVAMIINTKGIKLKKLWRTVLITTIAVPQFISLMLMSNMFSLQGPINGLLQSFGWITESIPWFTDEWLARVMIIVINTWVGIPYTMLICTGLLMNIPDDLYESAKIDGASPVKTYMKITLPYMLFVTTPYLISQFVGNINNFNVIYLLTNGGPSFTYSGSNIPYQVVGTNVGKTDLLITWIYKMTKDSVNKDYGMAAVLGIIIFVVVAFFSLIFYNHSNSVKNEEDFQ